MEPYRYLQEAARALDSDTLSRDELNTIVDELKFIFEVLDPEFQDLATDLIARYRARLESAEGGN